MPDPLASFRQLSTTPAEAVRWACILEATAPKPGNVFPGRSFVDLTHSNFVAAAEITARCFGQKSERISNRMLAAVDQVQSHLGTNVNLGIILLLGPMVAADERASVTALKQGAGNPTSSFENLQAWIPGIEAVLEGLNDDDGELIFMAIQRATAGGMGTTQQLDVGQTHTSVDILQAMELAKTRDRIGLQYSDGYRDLICHITPVLLRAIQSTGDVLSGICHAHVHLLKEAPDTLIARKNGIEVASNVQQRASVVDPFDPESMESFDQYLRANGHQLNPGTTADLLAASLYLILRTITPETHHE